MYSYIQELKQLVKNAESAISSLNIALRRDFGSKLEAVMDSINAVMVSQQKSTKIMDYNVGSILSGDLSLVGPEDCDGYYDGYLSASALNSLVPFQHTFEVKLATKDGYHTHDLINTPAIIAVSSDFADGTPPDNPDVKLYQHASLDPGDDEILSENPEFSNGLCGVAIVFDVGAGKVYTNGDTIEVSVKISSDDTLLGFDVSPFVITYVVGA